MTFSAVATNADGSYRTMYQSSEYMKKIGQPLPDGEMGALEFCASKGMHLPTAREIAQILTALGSTGISPTEAADSYLVSALEPDGSSDYFYFSNAGYNDGFILENGLWFWSASVAEYEDPSPQDYAYFLDGKYGTVNMTNRSDVLYADAVLAGCLPGL